MRIDNKNLTEVKNVLEHYNIKVQFHEDEMARWDLDAWYNNKQIKVECKRRRFNSNKWLTTIINKPKYDFLVKNNGILIVTFDDVMLCFKNLKKAFVKNTDMWCSKTEDFLNKTKSFEPKVELNMKEAVIIARFDNNHKIISYDNKSI